MELIRVYDSTLLSNSKVYQINGTLYRFRYENGTIQHPQYTFTPLNNQRKTANLVLNRNKLITKCYEVEGMSNKVSVIDDNSVQMKLL